MQDFISGLFLGLIGGVAALAALHLLNDYLQERRLRKALQNPYLKLRFCQIQTATANFEQEMKRQEKAGHYATLN